MRSYIVVGGVLLACLMIAPGIFGGKPAPPTNPEKIGELSLTDGKNLAVAYPGSDIQRYIRVFDWIVDDNGVVSWVHIWSGDCVYRANCVLIGDVDNDNADEVVAFTYEYVQITKKTSESHSYITIWDNNAKSDEPTGKIEIPSTSYHVELGNVDGDSAMELIAFTNGGYVEIWDITKDNAGEYVADRSYNGFMGVFSLEVANCDDDVQDEVLVGYSKIGDGTDGGLALLDWTEDGYVRSTITEDRILCSSVGDLDDDGDNEIFATRNEFGKYEVYVYEYDPDKVNAINGYVKVWTGNYNLPSLNLVNEPAPLIDSCAIVDLDGEGPLEVVALLSIGNNPAGKITTWYARALVWTDYGTVDGEIEFPMQYNDFSGSIEVGTQRYDCIASGYPTSNNDCRVVWAGTTIMAGSYANDDIIGTPTSQIMSYGNYAIPYIG